MLASHTIAFWTWLEHQQPLHAYDVYVHTCVGYCYCCHLIRFTCSFPKPLVQHSLPQCMRMLFFSLWHSQSFYLILCVGVGFCWSRNGSGYTMCCVYVWVVFCFVFCTHNKIDRSNVVCFSSKRILKRCCCILRRPFFSVFLNFFFFVFRKRKSLFKNIARMCWKIAIEVPLKHKNQKCFHSY